MSDPGSFKILFALGVAVLLGACETPNPSKPDAAVVAPTKKAARSPATPAATATPTPSQTIRSSNGPSHQTGTNL